MQFGRGAVSGAEFAPFPSPLPPASGTGWANLQPATSSLEFLSPSFLLRMGRQCVSAFCRLILSLSLAIPQCKLLSHVSSLRLLSGHSGLVLTLSNAARSSLFSPHLLVADASIWGTFLLGVVFMHVICRFYLFVLPIRLPSKFQKFPQTCQCKGFLVFGNFLYYYSLPGMGLRPQLFCLSFYLLYFVLPPFEDHGLLFLVPDVFC